MSDKSLDTSSTPIELILDQGVYTLANKRATDKVNGKVNPNLGEDDSITSLETYNEKFGELEALKEQVRVYLISQGVALKVLNQLGEETKEDYLFLNLVKKLYGADTNIIKKIESLDELVYSAEQVLKLFLEQGAATFVAALISLLFNYCFELVSNYTIALGVMNAILSQVLYHFTKQGVIHSSQANKDLEKGKLVSKGVKEFVSLLHEVEKIESYLKIYGSNPLYKKECATLYEAKQIILAIVQGQGHVLNQKILQKYNPEDIKLRITEQVSAKVQLQTAENLIDEIVIETSAEQEAYDTLTLDDVFKKLDDSSK